MSEYESAAGMAGNREVAETLRALGRLSRVLADNAEKMPWLAPEELGEVARLFGEYACWALREISPESA